MTVLPPSGSLFHAGGEYFVDRPGVIESRPPGSDLGGIADKSSSVV